MPCTCRTSALVLSASHSFIHITGAITATLLVKTGTFLIRSAAPRLPKGSAWSPRSPPQIPRHLLRLNGASQALMRHNSADLDPGQRNRPSFSGSPFISTMRLQGLQGLSGVQGSLRHARSLLQSGGLAGYIDGRPGVHGDDIPGRGPSRPSRPHQL